MKRIMQGAEFGLDVCRCIGALFLQQLGLGFERAGIGAANGAGKFDQLRCGLAGVGAALGAGRGVPER